MKLASIFRQTTLKYLSLLLVVKQLNTIECGQIKVYGIGLMKY